MEWLCSSTCKGQVNWCAVVGLNKKNPNLIFFPCYRDHSDCLAADGVLSVEIWSISLLLWNGEMLRLWADVIWGYLRGSNWVKPAKATSTLTPEREGSQPPVTFLKDERTYLGTRTSPASSVLCRGSRTQHFHRKQAQQVFQGKKKVKNLKTQDQITSSENNGKQMLTKNRA